MNGCKTPYTEYRHSDVIFVTGCPEAVILTNFGVASGENVVTVTIMISLIFMAPDQPQLPSRWGNGNNCDHIRHQAITWVNIVLLSTGLLGTDFNEIYIRMI